MIKGVGPNKNGKYVQDFYVPKNPHKYIGKGPIIYRSSWELRFCTWCDLHPNIVKWNSEGIMVPYISPLDGKTHRYYIDFWVQIESSNNSKQYIIELKPKVQTQLPGEKLQSAVNEGKATAAQLKRYNRELRTYIVNMAKFKAATKFAYEHNLEFKVCDEDFLF